MAEVNGYKTLDLVMKDVGAGEPKVRQAIAVLNIVPTTFNKDKRVKFYSPDDIQRIKKWLEEN